MPKSKFSPELVALGQYLAGEFENRQQATDNPAWYVHLHLWKRPVPIFTEDSLTLYAEQVNIVNPDQPYRPRVLRLRQHSSAGLQVEYYMLKDITALQGAGRDRQRLNQLTPEQIEFLPECTLNVKTEQLSDRYRFTTAPASGKPCSFTYQGNRLHISLGFEATSDELLMYDKGIDPDTGKTTWGPLMGPFRFSKRQDFSDELPVKVEGEAARSWGFPP